MNRYTYEELQIGLTEGFSVQVTEEMMAAFRNICGDDNPMHIDEAYAKANGCDAKLVYGMLTSSFYSTLAGVYLPGERCLLQEITVKFLRPVYPGDILKITGEITARTKAYQRVEIKAKIYNQNRQTVSTAKIKAGVRG